MIVMRLHSSYDEIDQSFIVYYIEDQSHDQYYL